MKRPHAEPLVPGALPPLAALLDDDFQEWPDLGEPQPWTLPPSIWEDALLGPAREFLSRPGKSFRGNLVTSTWELGGGTPEAMPAELPLLVEILHAGSLIIDDIQDESAERRGRSALHHEVGTAVALNTGNWMYYWPQVLLARLDLSADTRLALYEQVSLCMLRCHQGQALDLGVRVFEVSPTQISSVVATTTRLKTASLMQFAAVLGARASGADSHTVATVADFGTRLGMALQMLDDLGGILSAYRRAKGIEDLRLGRPTWPWAWLAAEASEVTLAGLLEEARAVHDGRSPDALLSALRDHLAVIGPAQVRSHLAGAVSVIKSAFPDHAAVHAIEREVERLERSYV